MSINTEKVNAQRMAFKHPTQDWHRHLIGPAELEMLLEDFNRFQNVARLQKMSASEMRLQFGEMTASEIRLVRAIANSLLATPISIERSATSAYPSLPTT